MTNRYRLALALLTTAPLVAGCADDKQETPQPPVLGIQIDRIGRPAVNTAVSDGFFADAAAHGTIQNNYNNASNPSQWGGLYGASFAANLAIYDSLDRVCGNQLLAGPTATAGRYATLAGVLADDRLWVNSTGTTCGVYLAVEANATGLIPNADCGGRTPLYDTIDVTYSAFAIGAISGVGDGIAKDVDSVASLTEFPFLAPPK